MNRIHRLHRMVLGWLGSSLRAPRMRALCAVFVLMLLCQIRPVHAQGVHTFSDIKYWVGSGENEAAMVIDWNGASNEDQSLVWGFRWDGAATGETMLRAILTEDDRLYAKLNTAGGQDLSVFGLGYDFDDDKAFAISDMTSFNAQGIAITGPPDGDGTIATPLGDDLYVEGWFSGYWAYSRSDRTLPPPFDGGALVHNGSGPTNRILLDGDWDSWGFSTSVFGTAFAENPIAALPPLISLADFDNSGNVGPEDLATWKLNYGLASSALHSQGDADGDGDVDGTDFLVWQTEYSSMSSTPGMRSTTNEVPEPNSQLLAFLCIAGGMAQLIHGYNKLV